MKRLFAAGVVALNECERDATLIGRGNGMVYDDVLKITYAIDDWLGLKLFFS